MSKYLLEVDDALWRKVKLAAALKSVPIKTYIADLLKSTLKGDLGAAESIANKAVNIGRK